MRSLSVVFTDAIGLTEKDRRKAEAAYSESLLAQVPNIELLARIWQDDLAGLNEGVEHFETLDTAWSEVNRLAERAVEEALGFWPGEAAHFEVEFTRD